MGAEESTAQWDSDEENKAYEGENSAPGESEDDEDCEKVFVEMSGPSEEEKEASVGKNSISGESEDDEAFDKMAVDMSGPLSGQEKQPVLEESDQDAMEETLEERQEEQGDPTRAKRSTKKAFRREVKAACASEPFQDLRYPYLSMAPGVAEHKSAVVDRAIVVMQKEVDL